jgi:aldehyde dehydrogenase (NAD+)
VQEGIAERFHDKLKRRMDGLRIGDPLDKCIDMGAVVDPIQLATITDMVATGRRRPLPRQPAPARKRLLLSAHPDHRPRHRLPPDAGGNLRPRPGVHDLPHPDRGVDLANNTRYGLAASIWTENVNLALDIAPKVKAGVVWVNATNLFDAAAGFGGVRESALAVKAGGKGCWPISNPPPNRKAAETRHPCRRTLQLCGPRTRPHRQTVHRRQTGPPGWRLFPRGLFAQGALLGHVGLGNRKDIRNAVEAAHAAKGWGKATGHNRAQILYYIAENLSARAGEFAARLRDLTGKPGRAEVDASIQRLFTYAAWADKFDGQANPFPCAASRWR